MSSRRLSSAAVPVALEAEARPLNDNGGGPNPSQQPIVRVRRPVLDEVTIEYGPRDLLAPYLLWAVGQCRLRGIELEFVTMAELTEANRRNSGTWLPLFPAFDAIYGADDATAYAIVGRDVEGEIVATQAGRFYDLSRTDFGTEMESLRFCYADVAARRAAGEACTVTAEAARLITGRVVYSGGGWYRPDFRKRGFFELLPRISRAYAFARWQTDFTMTLMTDKVFAGGNAAKAGYQNVDWSIDVHNSPLGDLHAAVLWMDTAFMLEDLRSQGAFVRVDDLSGADRVEAQVDTRVENRA